MSLRAKDTVGDHERFALKPELAFLLAACCIYAITGAIYLPQPLLDVHAFRQCQTAVTAEWLSTDLNPLRMFVYETPLLGAPWRIPMEFPLFQWLVAVVHRLTGLEIDLVGRSMAMVFHLACLWPAWVITRSLGGGFRHWAVYAGLSLLAPVYHHWSRACLIETMAVFLAMAFLAAAINWLQTGKATAALAATAAAVLAALVKVTTFPPFAAAAVCYGLWLAGSCPTDQRRPRLVRLAGLMVPYAAAIVCLVMWVQASDAVKAGQPLSATLTSSALRSWNYGSLAQRLSPQLWLGTIALRAIPEAGGWIGAACVIAALVLLRDRRRIVLGFLCLAYLGSFLVFTNLHVVHDYYQVANGCILVAAIAIAICGLTAMWPIGWSWGLLTALLLTCLWTFRVYAAHEWVDYRRRDARLMVAAAIAECVPPEDVIMVAGMDWSSEIAFYAKRRAIYITIWFPHDTLQRLVDDPTYLTDGRQIGALVILRGSHQFLRADWDWDVRNNDLLIELLGRVAGDRKPLEVGPYLIAIGDSARLPVRPQPQ